MAHFSPSCVHHSQANAHKMYERPATLFDHIHGTGPEPEASSGYASSERSRVTMSCVIRYADAHRPDLMIVENVVEAAKWGPNRNGDTFRWWLGQLDNLGYRTRPLMLNSAAFGVPQMRDRMFVICWRKTMRTPDLEHRVEGWCQRCAPVVEARQVFRHRTTRLAARRVGEARPAVRLPVLPLPPGRPHRLHASVNRHRLDRPRGSHRRP